MGWLGRIIVVAVFLSCRPAFCNVAPSSLLTENSSQEESPGKESGTEDPPAETPKDGGPKDPIMPTDPYTDDNTVFIPFTPIAIPIPNPDAHCGPNSHVDCAQKPVGEGCTDMYGDYTQTCIRQDKANVQAAEVKCWCGGEEAEPRLGHTVDVKCTDGHEVCIGKNAGEECFNAYSQPKKCELVYTDITKSGPKAKCVCPYF